jgi:hypothetical protein
MIIDNIAPHTHYCWVPSDQTADPVYWTHTSAGTLRCKWCGKDLSGASSVTYLNGNQPVCDLCLMKARDK